LAGKGQIKLAIETDADVPAIKADQEKLRRVLVNLVSNAVQHTPNGGVVRVSARPDPDSPAVVFEITDTGFGIPKEAFGNIFEKFGQVNVRRKGKISTGLGLPFCKMVVEAHGGHITVESELGQGTVFRFAIPAGPR
jgi:signal transduction histidine kinase